MNCAERATTNAQNVVLTGIVHSGSQFEVTDDATRNRQLIHAIAVNLLRLRNAAGLSQGALADRAGVHRNTIANLEGEVVQDLKKSTLDGIAAGLGVPTDALVAPIDVEPTAAKLSLERFLASEFSDATPEEAAKLRSGGWPWGDPGVKGWMKLLEVMRSSTH